MRQPRDRRTQVGAAVVDFVLVLAVLIPLVLGILQVALVLLVRNTLAAAASEGARYAAVADHDPNVAIAYTRSQIDGAISGRFAQDVDVRRVVVDGQPVIEVTVRASIPALGIGGPAVDVEVTGHAIEEPDE